MIPCLGAPINIVAELLTIEIVLLSTLGPMVWYQKFEYAVSHWLQKATEHVIGCVLCSPGCFSLFRGSAVLADNVMKTYTRQATEATHHIQYDQGISLLPSVYIYTFTLRVHVIRLILHYYMILK